MTRFIFVTGGVVSSLGKGLAAASLAADLIARGYSVRLRKFDPYLNVDPGTMSPHQHGEVYVTDDGAETDLDLGHYERFTEVPCRASDSITTGKIYLSVISKERRGDYLGATVQVIPHITDEIKSRFVYDIEDDLDFLICEVGGTVGDIEGQPFLEAIRQFINEVGKERAIFIHLTLIPYIPSAKELKTKPTQHSVKELLSVGIQPDILLCRCDRPIPEDSKKKLALFCNMKAERVIEALDVDTIYQVPISYYEHGLDIQVLKYFGINPDEKKPDLTPWKNFVKRILEPKEEVTIAIIAKYTELHDAYKSLYEAITHAGAANNCHVNVKTIDADKLSNDSMDTFSLKSVDEVGKIIGAVDGVLVPGGFGIRGIGGKLAAIRYAREKKIPFFGICLGMQLAIVETARHVAGLKEANSTEFGKTPDPVVGLLTEWQKGETIEQRSEHDDLGGTMRLGSYDCQLLEGSLAYKVYGKSIIKERHRHRYEVNINYKDPLEKAGLIFSGLTPSGTLPEMCERPDHPWFLGMQFHPELKSYPLHPSPVFVEYIKAALKHKKG